MKKLIPISLMAVLCLAASKKDTVAFFNLKDTEKSFAKINENLYACIYEVSNGNYMDFLHYLKKSDKETLWRASQIDSNNWTSINSYNEPFVGYYHNHPAFKDYPVVNISHESAINYCNWLSEKYNASPKRRFKKVLFRLPTKAEWELAAHGGLKASFPWGTSYLKNHRGEAMANYQPVNEAELYRDKKTGELKLMGPPVQVHESISDHASITAPVKCYQPNNFGLYNMSGNVAEMLQEKGKTKGGCWMSYGYYLRIEAEDEFEGFTGSSCFIGFRPFMEILEK